MKATCTDCGRTLAHIKYVRPDYTDGWRDDPSPRPPLCKSCWEKAVKKADEEVRAAKR